MPDTAALPKREGRFKPKTSELMSMKIHTYAELQATMLADLRQAHPEWSESVFDSYEVRIATLFKRLERKQNAVVIAV